MEEFYENEILPEYKKLLKECLEAFNEIPNTKINVRGYKNTYELASKIGKLVDNN